MSKFFIQLIFVLFIFNVLSKDDNEKNDIEKYKNEFESSVVKYLNDNFLYKNEVVIVDKKAFKAIFKAIMDTDGAKVFSVFKKIYDKVVNEFIKEYYPRGVKTIKATQLHIIFEYENVMNKFNTYISKNKINEEDL